MITQSIKPVPKRTGKSTGKSDQRQHYNKKIPGNTLSLKPSKSTQRKIELLNYRKLYNIDDIYKLAENFEKRTAKPN